jgi:hopanoid-associated phosphorylase
MEVLISSAPVIAVAGMDFEARIASGQGIKALYGQDREIYLKELHALAGAGARGIISFGTAGGLSPSLRPGDVVVGESVLTANSRLKTSAAWSKSLLKALPHAHHVPIFGAEAPVLSLLEKEALWSGTGAAAVDMESRFSAELAMTYGIPYAVLRVIIDPAERSIPLSAMAGVRSNGTTDVLAVLRSVMRRPREVASIIRLAGDSRKANKSLFRCCQAVGPCFGLGLLDASELALDMA